MNSIVSLFLTIGWVNYLFYISSWISHWFLEILRISVNGVLKREVEIYLQKSGWTKLGLGYSEIIIEKVIISKIHPSLHHAFFYRAWVNPGFLSRYVIFTLIAKSATFSFTKKYLQRTSVTPLLHKIIRRLRSISWSLLFHQWYYICQYSQESYRIVEGQWISSIVCIKIWLLDI